MAGRAEVRRGASLGEGDGDDGGSVEGGSWIRFGLERMSKLQAVVGEGGRCAWHDAGGGAFLKDESRQFACLNVRIFKFRAV